MTNAIDLMAEAYEEMKSEPKVGASILDPESPERLRQCLTALALHTGNHVLRFEVGLGASTRVVDEPAFSMTLTHSMGPEHELAIIPELARIFATTMAAFGKKCADEMAPENESDGEPK